MHLLQIIVAGALALAAAGASAEVFRFENILAPEAAGASGTGVVVLEYDTVSNDLFIDAIWSGLSGVTTVAHIHCCVATRFAGNASVAVTPATLPGFPVGVSAGSYSTTIDLDLAASFTAGFLAGSGGTVAGAQARLLGSFVEGGRSYFNIHTSRFPDGEIRAFVIPEPATYALVLLAAAGIGASRRSSFKGK
jgi:hypothetical protein